MALPRTEDALESLDAKAWCSDFGQNGLDAVVRRAWSDNVQLKAAWARLKQAQALAQIASASLWPSVRGDAELIYSSRDYGRRDTLAGADLERGDQTAWELSARAAYEIDVWGRNRHRANAAGLESAATEASARSFAMTLTSEVAEAWFDVIAHRERLELLEAQLEVSREILEITRLRLQRGIASALDVAQQEQNVESLVGQVSLAQGLASTSQHRLAVLVGMVPGEQLEVAGTLPDVIPVADDEISADVLERRPDVRAAHLMLRAADERTAAAVADRLPRLQLSAATGFQSGQLVTLFEQLFASLGVGISQVFFAGGRLRAEIERSEAVAQEQLFNYAQTILVALREGMDALVLEKRQYERIASLERELRIGRTVLDLARTRYRNGAVGYLRVLTALRDLQEVQRVLLEARRQQLSHRILLCRALGGTWIDSVEPSLDLGS